MRKYSYLAVVLVFTTLSRNIGAADEDLDQQPTMNYFETYLSTDQDRNAIKVKQFKWPNGIVPYIFGDEYIERDKAAVLSAMEIFRKETCIKFVLKTSRHIEHIKFTKSNGCGSMVGYRPNQTEPLVVTYSEHCLRVRGFIQHELLHALGLMHEHSRPDRDDYVDILWGNIEPQYRQNFEKIDSEFVETFDLPYDYDSLMHYPRNAFAKIGTNATIVSKKDPERNLGQSKGPTYYDLEKLQKMYENECVYE